MEIEKVKHLKSSDRLAIKALYNDYRKPFLNFGKSYGLDESSLLDIYQEAFLALRRQAIHGKLNNVSCSLKTYLFGIGKHMIFDNLKLKKQTISLDFKLHVAEDDNYEEISVKEIPELTEEQKLLRNAFIKLGKKCQSVLTLFYYHGLTIEDIVEQTQYENANTVKAQKSRCLKTLKELINK